MTNDYRVDIKSLKRIFEEASQGYKPPKAVSDEPKTETPLNKDGHTGAESLSSSAEKKSGTPLKTKRSEVLKEIVCTEKAYVQDLTILIDVYANPLSVDTSIIEKEENDAIFLNVKEILKLHQVLLADFERSIPNIDEIHDDTKFGKVFLFFADFMKIYITYILGYEKAGDIVKSLESNRKFANFLKETESKSKGLNIKDYLIKPVQRICKYPMLFRELLDTTPIDHPDYSDVQKTFNKMRSVVEVENQLAAEDMNFGRICVFNENVTGYKLDPSQDWLIHDEILTEKSTGKKRHLYLLSDSLIITKKIAKKEMMKLISTEMKKKERYFASHRKFDKILVRNLPDLEFEIEIEKFEEKTVLSFLATTNASRQAWKNCVERLATQTEFIKKPQNAYKVVDMDNDKKLTSPDSVSKRNNRPSKASNSGSNITLSGSPTTPSKLNHNHPQSPSVNESVGMVLPNSLTKNRSLKDSGSSNSTPTKLTRSSTEGDSVSRGRSNSNPEVNKGDNTDDAEDAGDDDDKKKSDSDSNAVTSPKTPSDSKKKNSLAGSGGTTTTTTTTTTNIVVSPMSGDKNPLKRVKRNPRKAATLGRTRAHSAAPDTPVRPVIPSSMYSPSTDGRVVFKIWFEDYDFKVVSVSQDTNLGELIEKQRVQRNLQGCTPFFMDGKEISSVNITLSKLGCTQIQYLPKDKLLNPATINQM
eukprot:TRINITY_DN375_c2_g1_i1.p1 TRINITY_DN375_c2_g1~~TRINITY_DN375_c2_g1_i1.p1  ORF type:complete len:699 (-),score=169.83 TRINITY_DN375_c2_g1_i1:1198-3294(-)